MDRSALTADSRVRHVLRDAEARVRVRWQAMAGRYIPVAERTLDAVARAGHETVAALLTGPRARYQECA